jgi:hypothetical protein
MRARNLTLALIAVLALGLTACSKAASAPSGTTTSTASATASATTTATAEAMKNSNPNADSLLSVADVEKATGMSGLKLVDRNSSPNAVGRLNFASADGTIVAIMTIGDAVAFDQSMQGMNFSKVTTGTGDMCYVGPSSKVSPTLTLFAAAKGDHAVIMQTFLKTKGGTEAWVSIDKLQALTGLALQRWGA